MADSRRGLICTAESVRAILADRKGQTRRVITPQPQQYGNPVRPEDGFGLTWRGKVGGGAEWLAKYCRYGQAGDLLWVRESWLLCREVADGVENEHGLIESTSVEPWEGPVPSGGCPDGWGLVFRATDLDTFDDDGMRWRSPIYMPRWASRITLRIKNVRIERVTDISEQDARAEGVMLGGYSSYINAFTAVWQRINGKPGRSWADRPWVWVLEFERVPDAD